eukprot:11216850-Lingulodinium_polyedra.AAC.1
MGPGARSPPTGLVPAQGRRLPLGRLLPRLVPPRRGPGPSGRRLPRPRRALTGPPPLAHSDSDSERGRKAYPGM